MTDNRILFGVAGVEAGGDADAAEAFALDDLQPLDGISAQLHGLGFRVKPGMTISYAALFFSHAGLRSGIFYPPDRVEELPVEVRQHFRDAEFPAGDVPEEGPAEVGVGGEGMGFRVKPGMTVMLPGMTVMLPGMTFISPGISRLIQRPDLLLLPVLLRLGGGAVREQAPGEHGAGRGVGGVENVVVEGGQLDGRVQGRGRGATDQKRRGEAPGGHFAAKLLHLVERRGDEPADADDVGADRFGLGEDGLAGDHDPEVGDLKTVASQHDAENILSDVMDVALDGGEQDARLAGAVLGGAHVGLQDLDGVAHHLGGLDDLREEHLAGGEAFAHAGHAVHQRPLDDFHRTALLLQGFHEVLLQGGRAAGNERAAETLGDRTGFFAFFCQVPCFFGGPARIFRGFLTGLGHLLRQLDQPLRRFGVAVQDHVLDGAQQPGLDGVVGEQHPRVDDAHVQARRHGVVEEGRVHRFADRVVATEGEREVGDAAGAHRSRQVLLDPAHGFDEVHAVAGVFRDAGADRQDVDVEDDFPALVAGLLREQPEGALADLDLALVGRGLALLVESHHDHRRAQAADFAGFLQEDVGTFLEGNGVDDAAPLGILEAREDRLPVGGVDHQRGLGDGRVAGDVARELLHLDGGVEHRVVHIDVDHRGAAFDLAGGYLQGGVVLARGDEFGKFARAGHVGALADVGEAALPHVQADGFQAADIGACILCGDGPGLESAHGCSDGGDVLGGGAAAAADEVNEAVRGHLPQRGGGLLGAFVIGAHLVGQAGVGVAAHGAVRPRGDVRDERSQVGGAERAVESEAERPGVLDGTEERFQRLAGEGASAAVGDGHGDEQRQRGRLGNAADGIEGGLGVEGVEAGLQQQRVHAAFHQAADLPGIRLDHLVEGDRPPGGVAEILREGEGFPGRAHRAGHPDLAGGGVGLGPGQRGACAGEFARLRGAAVVGLRNGVGAEGVGADDVRAGVDVGAVDAPDDVRMGEVERLAVAAEAVALEHRAHRPVQDQDPVADCLPEFVHQKQSFRTLMTLSLRPIV